MSGCHFFRGSYTFLITKTIFLPKKWKKELHVAYHYGGLIFLRGKMRRSISQPSKFVAKISLFCQEKAWLSWRGPRSFCWSHGLSFHHFFPFFSVCRWVLLPPKVKCLHFATGPLGVSGCELGYNFALPWSKIRLGQPFAELKLIFLPGSPSQLGLLRKTRGYDRHIISIFLGQKQRFLRFLPGQTLGFF